MEKLAIFGGEPVRKDRIYYGRQCIGEDDIAAVAETLRGPLITCGPKVEELESKLCEITKAKHAVAVSNGTAALHIACMALGIKHGDEVIVSSMTFAASANCVLYCGGTPVFADIRPDTYNIDVEDVK
ncbi:MAG: aminotransferase class I/II-fold pyridoxal phosphate-dependent enzyme, partial [Lachnospiraceae bacterium]|nr:aminotransferase class I/II-fold pyridoxal phosphate-dependent enzyme [Lachnospiraceae bacterium]